MVGRLVTLAHPQQIYSYDGWQRPLFLLSVPQQITWEKRSLLTGNMPLRVNSKSDHDSKGMP